VVALAALAITGEFATGSIRTTLAATPARWAVLTAKAAVVGAVTFPAGLVATALATLTASTILGIGSDGIGAVSARSAAALTLTGVLVVGLGAVLRSAAGTITTAVAVLFAPPILGAIVSNEVVATVLDYLPAGLTTVLVGGSGGRYSPQMAALLLGAWAVVALAAGAIALHRRDP
jgi:ABC-2 type transport system permease protein